MAIVDRMQIATSAWLKAALVACLFTGCLRTITDRPLDVAEEGTDAAAADATAAKKVTAPEEAAPTLAEVEQLLTSKATRKDAETKRTTLEVVDGWYRPVGTEDQWSPTPGEYRWRHDGLAKTLQTSKNARATLRAATKSKEPLVQAVAIIGLARLEPDRHAQELVALARNINLPATARRAAIETLASAPDLETEAHLRTLVERFGPTDQGVCQEPLLYAEVLAGLARHSAADQDPLFTEALRSSEIDVQLAALSLLAASTSPQLPPEVEGLVKSPHARVRRAALAALVAGEHPTAVTHLEGATLDSDLFVRVGAIELLGKVKDQNAVLLLYDMLNAEHERHREAAASALVQQQEWPAVERAAHDPSYRVRVAVATALAKHPDARRMALAKELIRDSSAMVQAKMCESLASWPPELAAPLLFDGLASLNMLTRQTSLKALTKHKIDCQSFNPGAPPPERATALAALRDAWQKKHPAIKADEALAVESESLSRAEVLRLVRQLQTPGDREAQWIARKQLERFGKPLLPAIDQLVRDQHVTLEEDTYREVLAPVCPALQAIEELRAVDVMPRRAAARKLAQETRVTPLPHFVLHRLTMVVKSETDALVWADVLRAAAQTKDFAAHDLAVAALLHTDADVRRRACEYLALCGDKRQSDALAALLSDRDPVVVKGAIVALGHCGPPASREPVYVLLTHVDVNLQIIAAQTVARWNDDRGRAALERLALASSPIIRRQAVTAMGEVADLQFVDAVVRALDDETSVQVAALAALPKVSGSDPLAGVQPPPVSAQEKARVWQAWHAKRR
jgi:HEAT repeat protein